MNKTQVRNVEHLEALQVQAAAKNPNRKMINDLLKQRDEIDEKISSLRTDDERALTLESFFKSREENRSLISHMSDKTFFNRVMDDVMGDMNPNSLQYFLCVELIQRAGYDFEELE